MQCERGRERFRNSANREKWRMKTYAFTIAERRATDDGVAEKKRRERPNYVWKERRDPIM